LLSGLTSCNCVF